MSLELGPSRPGFKPEEISTRLNASVVSVHAEDTGFLWMQRDRAALAPNYSLGDLALLDERVEAHLQGLRVARSMGWELCLAALADGQPGAGFSVAALAAASGDSSRFEEVQSEEWSDREREVVSALGWLQFECVEPLLVDFLDSGDPVLRRIGVAGYAVHRRDPGLRLAAIVSDPAPRVRARALGAVGELGRCDLLRELRRSQEDIDEGCRFEAAWSSVRLGDRSERAVHLLRQHLVKQGDDGLRALMLLARVESPNEIIGWVRRLDEERDMPPLLPIVIGSLGAPAMVDELISLMGSDETVARRSGEAFSMITGVDLEYEDLDRDAPEASDDEAEEDTDGAVIADPDEDLPWPDRDLVAEWWRRHRNEFDARSRYVSGQPISHTSLVETLLRGMQRQRLGAALELALSEPAKPLFEIRARGNWQIMELRS